MGSRFPLLVAALAVLGLVAASAGWALQARDAAAARDRAEELEAEVERLRDEVAALEDEVAAARRAEGGAPDEGDGLLDRLLDDGALGDLAGGAVPGARCLAADDDLLGGLLGADPLPEEPDELVDVVAEQVADLRELTWLAQVEVDFLDDAALSERLEVLLAEDADPDRLEAEQRMLASLGAIDGDLDLAAVQRDLLDEQVAGYYVPDTGELVVRVPDDGRLRPLDRVTLAHELQHALADQQLGLPDLDASPLADDADARLGALALIEGDATLLMQLWMLEHLSLAEQLTGALGGDLAGAEAALEAVPDHLQRELLYPYTEGLEYVCEQWLEGGWAAVDEAYEHPPATSHEVLFPDGDPVEPGTPPRLTAPEGATTLIDTTFGAAPLLWLFEAPGGDPGRALDDARERVAAWEGGRVVSWDLDGATVTGLALRDAAGTLCASMTAWHAAAFPEHADRDDGAVRTFTGADEGAALRCDGDGVRYAVAGDAATASGVVG